MDINKLKSKLCNNSGNLNPNIFRLKYREAKGINDYYQFVIDKTDFLNPYNPTYAERFYYITNDINCVQNCICGKKLVYKNGKLNKYCSVKCSAKQNTHNSIINLKGVSPKRRIISYQQCIEKFKINYGDRFEYLGKEEYYSGSEFQTVYCKKHDNKFICRLKDLKSGKTNCPICRKESLRKLYIDSSENFKDKLYAIKGDTIRLIGAYIDSHTTTEFSCIEHGSFYSKPYQMLQDQNCPKCYSGISKEEQGVVDYVRSLVDYDIITNSRQIIKNKEIDIVLDKILIEYNGLYWHSDEFVSNNYHLEKTELAEELGYNLLHIFSNEWKDDNKRKIWKSIIRNKIGKSKRIYARKTKLIFLNSNQYKEFLNINHLQGNINSSVKYGLVFENKLVAVMGFSKCKYKEYEWELDRFCNILETTVVGGAEKLFKHFIKIHCPKSILTYADRRHSNGNLYRKLGFEFSHKTNPNYSYTKDFVNIFSRYQCQKHKLKDLLEKYDESLTEYENMKANKFYKISDSGNLVFHKYF